MLHIAVRLWRALIYHEANTGGTRHGVGHINLYRFACVCKSLDCCVAFVVELCKHWCVEHADGMFEV